MDVTLVICTRIMHLRKVREIIISLIIILKLLRTHGLSILGLRSFIGSSCIGFLMSCILYIREAIFSIDVFVF